MNQFYKVSFEQFYKDFTKAFNVSDVIKNNEEGTITTVDLKSQIQAIYDAIELPTRATKYSAGYDFHSPIDINIASGTYVKIPTGIRCKMNNKKFLGIVVRSSLGFKYDIGLVNQLAVIDKDYFFADNEGHIFIKLKNNGTEDCKLSKGDRFAQGIFLNYDITIDDNATKGRSGGIGSTNEGKTSN